MSGERTAPGAPPAATDRRVLRGQRNRAALVDAVIDLIDEGELTPTAAQIAERAGVALRSLYHHFDDLDGLTRAVADEQLIRLADVLRPLPTDGPFEQRLSAFVKQRCALDERGMAVYRASLLAVPRNAAVADRLAFTDRFLREELAQTFAIELEGRPSWTLDALDALTSFEGWIRLRHGQGLSVRRAKELFVGVIPTMLGIPAAG
jgi:TetR/AcrR family transcriptional regulator of autoinduction and epiphytic fitness